MEDPRRSLPRKDNGRHRITPLPSKAIRVAVQVSLTGPFFVLVALLVLVGLTTSHWRTRSDTHYAFGAAVLVAFLSGTFAWLQFRTVQTIGAVSVNQDTYYVINGPGFWVGVVPIFLLFAGLMVWLRPKVSPLATGLHASGLMIAMLIAIIPPAVLFGAPRRYVDYEPWAQNVNLVQSSAAFLGFVLTIGGLVVIWIRRAR